jgi:hypothetical protein
MGLFDSITGSLGISGASTSRGSVTNNGTRTTQKQFSQEAIDKTIYDILASDQGLAALASAENASGGFGASSKTLLAQDLIAKVAGTIAQITAPEVTTESSKAVKKDSSVKTVICTHLAEQGYINLQLYLRGHFYHSTIPATTITGYQSWAVHVVEAMKKYPIFCRILAPIVRSRYEFIVLRKLRIMGAATVYIGEPLCHLIGLIIQAKDEINGRAFN